MIKALEQAIAELARLPESDQEQIGQQLLTHVERLRALRAEIDRGILSLNEGHGTTLDMEELIRGKNSFHGKS
jgi:hypothetical protein